MLVPPHTAALAPGLSELAWPGQVTPRNQKGVKTKGGMMRERERESAADSEGTTDRGGREWREVVDVPVFRVLYSENRGCEPGQLAHLHSSRLKMRPISVSSQ